MTRELSSGRGGGRAARRVPGRARRLARGGAAADRRRAACSSTARARPSATLLAGGRARARCGEPPAAPEPRGARGARSRSPTRTSTCWWSTSRRAWSCTRRAGTATGTLAQALAGRVAGGDDPERAGHRAPPRPRHVRPARRRAHRGGPRGAEGAAAPRARSRASTSRWSRAGPPARRGTIDAPLGRDRRVRTRISTDTDEPREAITHFEIERALPQAHAAARAARDRAHAPDPRAPAGDRASGRRRSAMTLLLAPTYVLLRQCPRLPMELRHPGDFFFFFFFWFGCGLAP